MAGAHPNLTLQVNSPEKSTPVRNFNVHLPTGLVAATTAAAQCTQVNAAAGNCATPAVGTVATTIGTGGETLALSGSIYNVVPNASEPARLQAIIPVTVGPFDLGKLSIPVSTSLRADMGVDANTQLPLRYEGIAVRIRQLSMVLSGTVGGNNFITNPSKCQTNTVNADMISATPTTVTGNFNFVTTGCPAPFGAAPTLSVTPSTLASQTPVGLTVAVNSAATNSTINRIQLAMPTGMEINPGFGNGPLAACAPATVDAGGAGCPATSNIGTVSLTTPLLPAVADRQRLPGDSRQHRHHALQDRDRRAPPGPRHDRPRCGSGQWIDHDHQHRRRRQRNRPGHRRLREHPGPRIHEHDARLREQPARDADQPDRPAPRKPSTARSRRAPAGADATPTSSYTTTGCASTFTPTFTASVSTAAANAHPNLTLGVTSPDKDPQLRNFNVHLPIGLVANTTAAPQCSQANAAIGNCVAGNAVGTVNTSIGNGGDNYALIGTIYNVVPNATEPARLAGSHPGHRRTVRRSARLSIPVPTTLRADMGVDTTTQLPTRYEGIAVRIRSMQLVLNGTVGGNSFMTNPSKCQSNTISADMISTTPSTVTGTAKLHDHRMPDQLRHRADADGHAFHARQPDSGWTDHRREQRRNQRFDQAHPARDAGWHGDQPGLRQWSADRMCAPATVDAGGAGCPATSSIGTVSLTTPLLPPSRPATSTSRLRAAPQPRVTSLRSSSTCRVAT